MATIDFIVKHFLELGKSGDLQAWVRAIWFLLCKVDQRGQNPDKTAEFLNSGNV